MIMIEKPLLPPDVIELTDDDLECVIGGQTAEQFDMWRAYVCNQSGDLAAYKNSIYNKPKLRN
tara:strand:+ start:3265 stop:3453 length:189 start_codon:yes stop_codon:yes gene_type:complete